MWKLSKLEIRGFKSFADAAQLDFPEGITAVVGPNGCGKSNIVDAIRWVMGEQSAKLLRGRNMEDVIFSGTGESQPLGMAEVSLVLEIHVKGALPHAQGFGYVADLRVLVSHFRKELDRFVQDHLDLPDDRLTWRCEQVVRNYDPCISCSTHLLEVKFE